ncbi:flagellar hook capping protein [Xylanimonas oleitrophica]|uniref:Flagellar hook capping protein n=1 Tax=Xylanimonas oleitrophica TaxID=2607479 RepID=A0A2W5YH09_9MICO|nr:flagellar hook capping FlgD N-terminal domain-containing protein [Xylanimonas oleitrophica]PZR54131.1 flagellar hook capping protein [Xylanimonas oleitrophica]
MTIDAPGAIDVASLTTPRATTASDRPNDQLDRQAFLQLLVAQLRNQDPSNPMDTSQLMTQTTQLSMTESLTELADTQREAFALQMRATAASLVGQQVSYLDEAGKVVTGTASSTSYAAPVPTVRVGDVDVPLESVAGVIAATGTGSTAPTVPGTDATA